MSEEIKVDMIGMLDIKGDEQIRRGYKPDGLAPTLNTMQGGNRQPKIMIKENNKQGYSELEVPGVADLSFSASSTRRGRTQDGGKTCPTLDTCATGLTVFEEVKTGAIRGRGDKGKIKQKLEINNEEYINTLTTVQKDNVLFENKYRIRKLTPLECWRLMGFYDADFNNAAQVCSNSQLYKQAGNSIVVDVLEAIFTNLIDL